MAVTFYDNFKNTVAGGGSHGTTDFDVDTIKIQLHRTSAYTFSAAHEDEADLAAEVSEATMAIAGSIGDVAAGIVDFADTTFTVVAAGAAIDCAVIYEDSGVTTTSPLVCYVDGFTVTPNGNDIDFVWAAGGVLDFG